MGMDDPKPPVKFAVIAVVRGERQSNRDVYHRVGEFQERLELLLDEEFYDMKVAGVNVLIGEEAETDKEGE